jgi:hypothetical protein
MKHETLVPDSRPITAVDRVVPYRSQACGSGWPVGMFDGGVDARVSMPAAPDARY